MPNWCDNYVVITGSKEKMKPLFDYFDSSMGKVNEVYKLQNEWRKNNPEGNMSDSGIEHEENPLMRTLIPHDEEYKKIEESGDFLLNPQVTFYGCKWDFQFSDLNVQEVDESCITFSMDSAWSPPTEFCNRLAKRYGVDVTIQYSEGGWDFAGKASYTPTEEFEETYTYREGLYLISDMFWEEFDFYLENYFDEQDFEEPNFEDFMKDEFPFITNKDDIRTAKTWFDSKLIDYQEKTK
jgi:hypothetical protein